jgi:hypothetical protein
MIVAILGAMSIPEGRSDCSLCLALEAEPYELTNLALDPAFADPPLSACV